MDAVKGNAFTPCGTEILSIVANLHYFCWQKTMFYTVSVFARPVRLNFSRSSLVKRRVLCGQALTWIVTCVCVSGFKLKVSTCRSMSYGGWCVLISEIGVATSSAPSAKKTSHSATAFSAIAGSVKERASSPAPSATLSATALTNTSSTWLPSMEFIHNGAVACVKP